MPLANREIIADTERLQALRRTCLLDSHAEAAFDRLTSLASRLIGAPISLVSLIDSDRQYHKSFAGVDLQEASLSHSFCQHVVATGEPLVISDTRQHPLAYDNLAISEYNAIGYLGMPLSTSDGFNIGSLCVIDHQPRQWSEDEINVLRELATSVMMEIELRVKIHIQEEAGRKISAQELYGDKLKNDATKQFGVYDVVEEVGQGGMAKVYRCRHKLLNIEVAIKELLPEHVNYANFVDRFEREAKIVASLEHTNIVRVFDFGMQDDSAYMVMEYIHGQSLDALIKTSGIVPTKLALSVLTDIADALNYAHSRGIVHRDVKPANIMLRQRIANGELIVNEYQATLMDFGIARIGKQNTHLTDETILGTLDYISPEQVRCDAAIDGRADVYSLGITAYQMLTGKLPIVGATVAQLVIKHLEEIPIPVNVINPGIPGHISDAICKALHKNPDDRFSTADEFIRAMAIQ